MPSIYADRKHDIERLCRSGRCACDLNKALQRAMPSETVRRGKLRLLSIQSQHTSSILMNVEEYPHRPPVSNTKARSWYCFHNIFSSCCRCSCCMYLCRFHAIISSSKCSQNPYAKCHLRQLQHWFRKTDSVQAATETSDFYGNAVGLKIREDVWEKMFFNVRTANILEKCRRGLNLSPKRSNAFQSNLQEANHLRAFLVGLAAVIRREWIFRMLSELFGRGEKEKKLIFPTCKILCSVHNK